MKITKLLLKIFVFIFAQLTILFCVIIFPLLLPIYLYRFILSKSIRLFRKDLAKILTTRSQIMACDNLYVQPKSTLLVWLSLEGDVPTIEVEREYMMKHLVLLQDKEGRLKRPEFQQYITSWMGFYFWKWDRNFRPEHHFYEYDGPLKKELYTRDDLHEIGDELLRKPFHPQRSPWEWIYVRNCTTDDGYTGTTGMYVRVHHALADGFSILKLTSEIISSAGSLEPMSPSRPKMTTIQKILLNLAFIFKAPYEFLYVMLKSYDNNAWTVSESKLTHELQGAVHTKVPINYLKEIKNLHDTSFTSVILAGFAGGIRKFMVQNDIEIPKSIHCLYPLPMYNHPNKLRNFATICYVKLPLGEKDPKERLISIEKYLTKLKSSTVPFFMFFLLPFVGGLFPWMTNLLTKQYLVTAVVSNFPSPPDLVTYNHNQAKILDIIFLGGLLTGRIGVGLSAISYNGQLRIGAGLDKVFPIKIPATRLVENVVAEFDVLNALEVV